MTQNFLELAKKGDPRVLAGLINRALQSKGIAVKATQQGDITHFLFECSQDIPEPTALTDYLIQALTRLKAPPLALLLSVRAEGQREVAWQRRLSFDPQAIGSPASPPPPPPPAPANGSGGTVGSAAIAAVGGLNGHGAANVTLPTDPEEDTADYLAPEQGPGSEDTTHLWDDDEESDEGLGETDTAEDPEAVDLWDEAEPGATEAEAPFEPALDERAAEATEETEAGFEAESQSTSPSFFPFVTAAILALLFAMAGIAYRFFYYPSQQVVTDPTEMTTPATGTDSTVPPETTAPETTAPETAAPETTEAGTNPGDSTGTTGDGDGSDGAMGSETEGTDGAAGEAGETGPESLPAGVDAFDPTALSPIEEVGNPWYEGVSLAMDAAVLTQTASTPEEWKMIAARWERAIDLMAAVPSTDANYDQAQERVVSYQDNLAYALENASYE